MMSPPAGLPAEEFARQQQHLEDAPDDGHGQPADAGEDTVGILRHLPRREDHPQDGEDDGPPPDLLGGLLLGLDLDGLLGHLEVAGGILGRFGRRVVVPALNATVFRGATLLVTLVIARGALLVLLLHLLLNALGNLRLGRLLLPLLHLLLGNRHVLDGRFRRRGGRVAKVRHVVQPALFLLFFLLELLLLLALLLGQLLGLLGRLGRLLPRLLAGFVPLLVGQLVASLRSGCRGGSILVFVFVMLVLLLGTGSIGSRLRFGLGLLGTPDGLQLLLRGGFHGGLRPQATALRGGVERRLEGGLHLCLTLILVLILLVVVLAEGLQHIILGLLGRLLDLVDHLLGRLLHGLDHVVDLFQASIIDAAAVVAVVPGVSSPDAKGGGVVGTSGSSGNMCGCPARYRRCGASMLDGRYRRGAAAAEEEGAGRYQRGALAGEAGTRAVDHAG
mmetsp:Transcript_7735/g.21513  ORF Transcript_7735/g.21513 Transcript_7735/m.21513 type:complete len:446 (+) Transcript_7735:2376-3713(+)